MWNPAAMTLDRHPQRQRISQGSTTMMVVGLSDPRMKIEIEVTALKPET
jgi:hypothetical protein